MTGERVEVKRVKGRLVALARPKGELRSTVKARVTSINRRSRRVTQTRRFKTCVKRG